MFFRYAFMLAAGLTSIVWPTIAQASPQSDKGLQCAAILKFYMDSWPANHPSTAQANKLKADWLSFAETTSFPKPINIDAAFAAKSQELESKLLGMMGDPAATQAFVAETAQGCDAVPFQPVAPSVCKSYAEAEAEGAYLMIKMTKYNSFFDKTSEEQSESMASIQDATNEAATAEKAGEFFATASNMTSEEAMRVIALPAEGRKAEYQTCLKQMG